MARNDQAFASFLNTWIQLKQKDGTIDALYEYWILGRNVVPAKRRWSVVSDVLHWVD
jgi:ABC-type amino acid transport substrate-binding protein